MVNVLVVKTVDNDGHIQVIISVGTDDNTRYRVVTAVSLGLKKIGNLSFTEWGVIKSIQWGDFEFKPAVVCSRFDSADKIRIELQTIISEFYQQKQDFIDRHTDKA